MLHIVEDEKNHTLDEVILTIPNRSYFPYGVRMSLENYLERILRHQWLKPYFRLILFPFEFVFLGCFQNSDRRLYPPGEILLPSVKHFGITQ